MLIYNTNIPNIKCAVQYYIYKDKYINITQQQFGRAARGSSQIGKAIFLIKDWYKGLYKDIARPVKNRGRTGRAFQSQPSQLSREYRVEREILQQVSQEDKTTDFTSDISLKVSICSDANTNPSASDIGRELSLGKISIILPVDILLKKPVQCLKTDAEKKAALFYYMYTFTNEEKGYL